MVFTNFRQRHPRYTILVALALFSTIYFLSSGSGLSLSSMTLQPISQETLRGALTRSNMYYSKMLKQRKALIQKVGPTPKDIETFAEQKGHTVWDFFPPSFQCPHEVERVGTIGDGGKWTCGLSRLALKRDCVIYSFGINGESSFEAEVLSATRYCEIWGYDFSVDGWGPQIPSKHLSRVHFGKFGLGGSDKHDGKVQFHTLQTLMKQNGHTHIDLLKVDIEGSEFEALSAFIAPYLQNKQPLPFGQLQLEIHLWRKPFEQILSWWESLEDAGLRPFWTEPNLPYLNYVRGHEPDLAEYSFLNIKGDNIFIKNPTVA